MVTALYVGSGLFWTVAYLLIVRQGFVDRTYGMPLVALCANLSWEFIFSVVRPSDGPQLVVNCVWLGLDLLILYTVLRYGPREFPWLPRYAFYGGVAATAVLSFLAVDLFSRTFDDGRASYAAFGQNLLMSALFLGMLGARYGHGMETLNVRLALSGQSVSIGVAKLIGTALASAAAWSEGSRDGSAMIVYLYLTVALLDVAYLAAVIAIERTGALRRPAPATSR
jgi:hypothetical protein